MKTHYSFENLFPFDVLSTIWRALAAGANDLIYVCVGGNDVQGLVYALDPEVPPHTLAPRHVKDAMYLKKRGFKMRIDK